MSGLSKPKLKSITLHGFRGFTEKKKIHLALPNGDEGSGLTLLVGPNGGGKSSIIEVVRLLGMKTQPEFARNVRNTTSGGMILARYDFTNRTTRTLRSRAQGGYVTDWEGDGPTMMQVYSVPARRSIAAAFGKSMASRKSFGNASSTMTGDRSQLPEIASRLIQIAENVEEKVLFDADIQLLLGSRLDWQLDLISQHQYQFTISSPTGSHSNDGLGYGVLSLLFLVAAFFDVEPDELLCVDEPELSLHPQVQKRIASYLAEKSRWTQIVVATHSPFFTRPNDLVNGAELYRWFVGRSSCKIGRLSGKSRDFIKRQTNDLHNPHVFGIDAREVFFLDDKVLVVEGQEDVVFLQRIVDQLNRRSNHNVFGWGAGGAEKFRNVLWLLKDLGFSQVACLLDGDKAQEMKRLSAEFPRVKFMLLPADDIRDKPDRDKSIGKVGVCTTKGKLKPEFRATTESCLAPVLFS